MNDTETTEVKQAHEQVGNTEVQRSSVQKTTTVSKTIVAQQVIYYVGGAIIALLTLRLVFQLLGASQASGFVDFIYSLTSIFVAPFAGIFGEPSFGVSHFETSALVAIVIYGLLAVGIAKLFTLGRPQDEL